MHARARTCELSLLTYSYEHAPLVPTHTHAYTHLAGARSTNGVVDVAVAHHGGVSVLQGGVSMARGGRSRAWRPDLLRVPAPRTRRERAGTAQQRDVARKAQRFTASLRNTVVAQAAGACSHFLSCLSCSHLLSRLYTYTPLHTPVHTPLHPYTRTHTHSLLRSQAGSQEGCVGSEDCCGGWGWGDQARGWAQQARAGQGWWAARRGEKRGGRRRSSSCGGTCACRQQWR